jgi:hypothetical protein
VKGGFQRGSCACASQSEASCAKLSTSMKPSCGAPAHVRGSLDGESLSTHRNVLLGRSVDAARYFASRAATAASVALWDLASSLAEVAFSPVVWVAIATERMHAQGVSENLSSFLRAEPKVPSW